MNLIISRIVAEFNKIFAGTKRVGDSLKLEGRRMSALDVANASTLGYKSESALSVSKSVSADKAVTIQSFSSNGNAVVDGQGNPVYIKEHQLSVSNSQKLGGKLESALEVDISKRLRVSDTQIVDASNIFNNVALYRVKDTALVNGKNEIDLDVRSALTATNATKLNNKTESNLVVEKSRITTRMLSDDGLTELKESELRVLEATKIRNGTDTYTLYQLRDWMAGQSAIASVYINLSAASNTLTVNGSTVAGGTKTFSEIISHIKTDSNVEAYKATRLVTGDSTTPVKTGDQVKSWIIGHADFTNKVALLNSASADRATRFGDAVTNYSVAEMDARIKATVVDSSTNSTTVSGQTPENIITTVRQRILSQSTGTNGLTDLEISGFFDNNKVKIAVQAIKVNKAVNADTLTDGGSTITLSAIYDQVKASGQVYSSKYLYANPDGSGGLKTFIDITNAINTSQSAIINGASAGYDTLSEIETIVKNNKTAIDGSLATEITNRTNADTTLQTNINTEKGRINTILTYSNGSGPVTFPTMKSYVDTLTGDLTTSTTVLGGSTTQNVVNIANALETRLVSLEGATQTSSTALANEVDKIESAVGLKTNGDFPTPWSGYNYINSASTIVGIGTLLDTALKTEETARISQDNTLNGYIGTLASLTTSTKTSLVAAVNSEVTRVNGVTGTLASLTTTAKGNLVVAINEVDAAVETEATTRSNEDASLDTKITNANTAISNEITNRQNADGNLNSLTTTAKGNLVAAINENASAISSEVSTRTTQVGTLGSLTTTAKGNLVSAVNEVKASVTQEVTDRGAATGNLTLLKTTLRSSLVGGINEIFDSISSEIIRAQGVEGNLTSLTTTTKTSLVVAINEVKASVTQEVTDRGTAVTNLNTTLQGNINTEKGRITNIVSGLGFTGIDTNGTISFSGTTYLNSQTTVKAALTTLDETVRSNVNILTGRVDGIALAIDTDVSNNVVALNVYDATNSKYRNISYTSNGLTVEMPDNSTSVVVTSTNLKSNILSAGDIGVSGSVVPNTNSTYDLGTTTNRFNNSYTDAIHIGNNSIDTQSDTLSLNSSTRVAVNNGPFRLPLFNTIARDGLAAVNGDMIYNTDLDKFQGYQAGSWINLDGTT